MAPLILHVFGAFQVTLADGSTARFESDKTCALLIYLAVEADRPHRRDALVGLLWPDEPEQTARHNLRQALFSLRRTLGDATAQPPYLLITRDEIQFNRASDFTLDAARFQSLLAECASHTHARLDACAVCAPRLQQAVDLYRREFLQEFFLPDSAEFEEWAVARRETLQQRALDALSDLGNYYEGHGDLSATRHCASRQLELEPWREQAHRQMMRVFALEGQRGAAIAQYERCRRVLAEELGVEPSGETRELYEQMRAGSWTNRVESELLKQPSRPSSPLPTQLTPFIGRERELAGLGRLIADPACRCITLVGPGGIGKTRLALQAAANYRSELAQAVAFVPLATIDSVAGAISAIAEALGFSFYGPTAPRLQLLNYLRDKRLLLVLDNVEQLLVVDPLQANAVDLFIEILQQAAGIKLLLTSREPLSVQGEWVFAVEGLQIPEDDRIESMESSAAVALFLERGQRARVGFALGAEDRAALVRLCRLVGGTPLALELAATWARTLSVPEIVKEIERDLDFLSASLRDLPFRHRSIHAVFDHSWEMLTAEEQGVLAGLSAFHGRFRREAAEQVAGASLVSLSALVAKSLLRRTDTRHYDLHELVRQYAAAKLTEHAYPQSVAERHSSYYLDWLGRCAAGLKDRRQKDTVIELSAEVDNLRAAWEWAITYGDIARGCRVSMALAHLFELRTWLAEGETIFRHAAETIESRGAQQPNAGETTFVHVMRAHSAYFSFRLGKGAAAYAVLSPSARHLQSSTDQFAGMYALWYLGFVSWELGRFAEANESLQTSLEKARACDDRWWETLAGEYIGIVAHATGDYDRARCFLTEALAGARELGDPMLISHVLGYLSQTMQALDRTAEAEKLLRESLALARETGYRTGIGIALDRLGLLAQVSRPEEARTLFAASCEVIRETGDLRNLPVVLSHQGYNSIALSDVAGAQNSFIEVLRMVREGDDLPFALDALAGLAMIWAEDQSPERALELVIHILQHPAAVHPAAMQDATSRAGRLRAELESRLTPEQIQAVKAQAQKQSIEQVIGQVLGQAR